jgi:CelD/BcsL family acetyltransferase involved in cellulose biosynthesis
LLAERDGVAVGYLHGGRVGDHFRGLQFSFDQAHANVGLGNALQFRALGHLVRAGVRSYDLGGFSDYKGRWGDEGLQTVGIVLRPRNAAGTWG